MQFVYVDESGTGNEPIAVMVGVIADSHRIRVNNWAGLFLNQSIPKRNIYMNRSRYECAELFYKYAPTFIR